MNFIKITNSQIQQIANEISKRWKFENFGSYYNCIDTKTGQESNQGGAGNFASYHFNNAVESLYLNLIGEDNLYFDWQKHGVKETNDRKDYVKCIAYEIEHILCEYTNKGRTLVYEKLLQS
jgi:hypothetical protein